MKVICPKCQFENQADSMRVVCARCATIIDVRQDPGSSLDNGRRPTSGLRYQATPAAPPPMPEHQDVYATRIDDDFDDVLDIPRQNPANFQGGETTPVYEDVFSTPNDVFSTPGYDAPPGGYGLAQDRRNTADNYRTNVSDSYDAPSYGVPPEPEFMGWPVLPEDTTDPGMPSTGAFGKGGTLLKGALALLVFGGLAAVAWFLLSPSLGKKPVSTVATKPSSQTATGGSTTGSTTANPNTAPTTTGAGAPATGGAPGTGAKQVDIPPASATGATGASGHSPGATSGAAAPNTAAKPPVTTPSKPPVNTAPPTTAPPAPATTTPNRGSITLQVSSFPDQAQASERVASLKAAGVEARVVSALVAGKTWYRVQIGRFGSRGEAQNYGNMLRSKGTVGEFMVTPIS